MHFYPGEPNPDRHWLYFQIEDVDGAYEWMRGNGVKILDEPTDQPWHMREFNLRDFNGYHLRFGAANIRAGAPIEIRRIALDARIEERLAALVADLAAHKNMTISEVLEETLLHSFETSRKWSGSGWPARTLRAN